MAEITLQELNTLALDPSGTIELSEREYHDRISKIADRVAEDDKIKVILLAGPSGSGKTTSANLIADAIKARGEAAMVVSLDDFYLNADDPKYPRLKNGERDLECPEALDLGLLSRTIGQIAKNEPFSIPRYDFKVGGRVEMRNFASPDHSCVIIEGLHALNPKISSGIRSENILKLFVSVSTNVSEGDTRIISGRKIRFVRRLVRDSIYRGASAEKTLSMWHKVLAAEDIYLYPYKGTADLAFNTFHAFELSVMKGFAEKLISKSLCSKDAYVNTVMTALKKIERIDPALVPDDSLIKEFIPGGIYEALY